MPPEQRNVFYRGFNAVYDRVERGYAAADRAHGRRAAALMVDRRARHHRRARSTGFARVPTGFLPIEDQGYLLAIVQLPDGASLERTQKVLDQVQRDRRARRRASTRSITIAGVSALDNSATLANAGVAYVILKDWERARQRARTCCRCSPALNKSLGEIEEARILVLPPPPIQGIGNAAGFTMQIELRDGSFDLAKLQSVVDSDRRQCADAVEPAARDGVVPRRACRNTRVEVDRVKTQTLQLTVDQVFSALATYLGSSYVDQFNKFGRIFQIYVQARRAVPPAPGGHRRT